MRAPAPLKDVPVGAGLGAPPCAVAVAAVRPGEPSHVAARARLASLLVGDDDVIVPAIFDGEVTSALVRAGSCSWVPGADC